MEPSMDQIEDYNGNESKEKKRTVNIVIIGLFVLGIVYATIKVYDSTQPLDIYVQEASKTGK